MNGGSAWRWSYYRCAMSRVLVLNATSEPIGVVSGRRAVVLSLDHKVDIVVHSDRVFVSERLQVPVPEVVRLRYYVRVPFQRHAPLNRRAVFHRDDHRCQYCSRLAESIDHVVPRSRGGRHEWTNVVACCRRCNSAKSDRLPQECGLVLRRVPIAPSRNLWLTVAVGTMPESWEPYLGAPKAA
jgi:5-methylcytosine-specific restriction endonuclease McrA